MCFIKPTVYDAQRLAEMDSPGNRTDFALQLNNSIAQCNTSTTQTSKNFRFFLAQLTPTVPTLPAHAFSHFSLSHVLIWLTPLISLLA